MLVLGTALGYPVPIVGATAATYVSILANTDILITDNWYAKDTRGLMTHEYGHYALCDLVRKSGQTLTEDFILTLDSLAAGGGDPTPDEEARIVNEAFADFFALQIAGGANYGWLRHLDGRIPAIPPSTSRSIPGGFTFSTGVPGADANIFGSSSDVYDGPSATVEDFAVGRLAGLMHDLFDGRLHGGAGPGSADAWYRMGGSNNAPIVDHRENAGTCASGSTLPQCRHGDVDLEGIALGGTRILDAINAFKNARNILGAYRVEAMEKGLIQTSLEATGNWCQTCLAAAPHFYGFRTNPADPNGNPYARDLIEGCQEGEALADIIGEPPVDTRELDAFTCEPCPPGFGMGRDGRCTDCPVDETIQWDGIACSSQEVQFSSNSNDFCPDTFVVEISGARWGVPATAIKINVAEVPETASSCADSNLGGQVSSATNSSSPLSDVGSFFIPGEYRVCDDSGGDDVCPGEFVGCHYPHPWEEETPHRGSDLLIPLSGVPSFYRVVADAGENGVNVSVEHNDVSCEGPVVR